MKQWIYLCIAAAALTTMPGAQAKEPRDFNAQILAQADWLARNRGGLGYDLRARYSEDLAYGDYVFRASGGAKTMCVAAVFETLIRALAQAKDANGQPVSQSLLPGRTMNGASALHVAPYVFQYKSLATFPEYRRKFSAGIGDALVLFGMGRYVTFETARPGDFLYFNRANGGGHATIFVRYLDDAGSPTDDAKKAAGFRYFSAQQGGTNGFGYRDAFFGTCPSAKTEFHKDCGVRRDVSRNLLAVSRLHDPSLWFPQYSAIRIERFFKGATIDEIYADEAEFRARAKHELAEAHAKAKSYTEKGLFPLIVPAIEGDAKASEAFLESVVFEPEFGPDFSITD